MSTFVQYAIDALALGSLYAVITLGIAMIFGIIRLLNFAHGELLMIGGFTLFSLAGPFPVMAVATIVVVVVAALAMDLIAFRPIRSAKPSTLLITSFALSYFLQNVGLLIYGGRPQSVALPTWFLDAFTIGGFRIQNLDAAIIITVAVLLAALVLFLRRTHLGIEMRAAAEDFTMARLAGVPANTVIRAAFAISGLLAAVASIFLVAQNGTVRPTMGVAPVLVAFVATIVGGIGSLVGAVLGGLLLGGLTVALQAALPIDARPFRDAFVFGIVIAILVFRPQGLVRSDALTERV